MQKHIDSNDNENVAEYLKPHLKVFSKLNPSFQHVNKENPLNMFI